MIHIMNWDELVQWQPLAELQLRLLNDQFSPVRGQLLSQALSCSAC